MTARRLVAELLGTAGLLLAIVGSGITAASGGPAPTQLFHHALVVGAALAALIVTFGPVSGAHFNPAVTVGRMLTDTFTGIAPGAVPGFLGGQVLGAVLAAAVVGGLFRPEPALARDVVVPTTARDP